MTGWLNTRIDVQLYTHVNKSVLFKFHFKQGQGVQLKIVYNYKVIISLCSL